MRGELFRTKYTDVEGFGDHQSTMYDETPRRGVSYQLYAACTATTEGRELTFKVGTALSGDLSCDGSPTSVDGLSIDPGDPVRVTLDGDHGGITSAYAILRPQQDE